MKLTAERDHLTNALGPLLKATGDMRPITQCVLLEAQDGTFRLSATDLRVALTMSLSAQVALPGTCAVEAKQLRKVVGAMPRGPVSVHLDDSGLELKTKGARFRLPVLPADDFPTIPKLPGLSEVKTSDFAAMVKRVLPAASNDLSRVFLAGIYLEPSHERLALVATDGYRLALTSRPIPFSGSGILPKHSASILLGLLEGETVGLSVDDGRLFARCGEWEFSTTLIDASFPDYRNVIPKGKPDGTVTVNRVDLITAAKALLVVSDGETRDIAAEYGDGFVLSARSAKGEGTHRLDAESTGTVPQVGLNATLVLDCLEAMVGETVTLEFGDALAPIACREGDDLWIIMPLRLE